MLATALAKLGVDQIVITSQPGRLATELQQVGVPVRSVAWRAGPSPSALFAILATGRQRPTGWHAHDAHSLTLVGLASKISRQPFVVTRRVDLPLHRHGFWTQAAQVIAVSDAVRCRLIADGIDLTRVTLIPSAIDLPGTRAIQADTVRADLGLPPTGPLAVTVAALVRSKGHQAIIRAAARLQSSHPDLHWAFAGEGDYRAALEALICDAKLGPHIHFVGHLTDPRPLIRAATVMVHCPSQEALGTTILDAMALGTPVVGSRVGGIPELLEHQAGFLADPADPTDLARLVAQAIDDEKTRSLVIQKATDVVARFGVEGMATKVLRVYRSVFLER